MRTRKMLMLTSVIGMGLVVVTGVVLAQSRAQRPDCPGKIVCPQTGELICRDQCPTVDPNRPDCPGRIVCPLTGELVCKDRCPLAKGDTTRGAGQSQVPPCCSNKG